jgi:hypothetical protein
MPRRARLDAPGTLHHVMVRGIERRRIVNDVADRKNFVERLEEVAAGTKKFNSIACWWWTNFNNIDFTNALFNTINNRSPGPRRQRQ